ncbi:hypothetical protein SDC9_135895 [bioreactor metagenome]|uniref:Uncharacterized protein n=1 Tax=bioreactor metagenome TaxID=1076179 RepID=A0A645DHS6_9ZZZZ
MRGVSKRGSASALFFQQAVPEALRSDAEMTFEQFREVEAVFVTGLFGDFPDGEVGIVQA